MSNKDLYINICKDRKDVPVFIQPWWLDVVCEDWDAAIAMKGDHITGIWPYPIEQKMGVTLLRTPLLTPYLGPQIFFPSDVKDSRLDSFEHETISELMKQLPAAKVWHLAIQPGIKQAGLFKQQKLRAEVQQTFLLNLKDSEEILLSNIKDTTRRNIKAAEKEITISQSSEHLEDLYTFHKQTLEKKGKQLPYTLSDLQRIMDACIANNATTLLVAKEAGQIQAIVWLVWDDNCSYYFMGGQNPAAGSSKAMSLLLWRAIKEAKNRGHKTFDLEGSMDEGVERFFRNFGADRALYIVLHKNDSLLWKLKKMILK